MRTRYVWKGCLGFIFLVVSLCLLMQPAFAAGKSKNAKDKEKTTTSVETPTPNHQDSIDMILAESNGPPINPGAGLYIKTRGAKAGTEKYFKNGHPNNNSAWTPYAQ
jgi:hypothetical protein